MNYSILFSICFVAAFPFITPKTLIQVKKMCLAAENEFSVMYISQKYQQLMEKDLIAVAKYT